MSNPRPQQQIYAVYSDRLVMAANGPSVGVVWVRCERRPHPNQQLDRNPAFGVPLPRSVRGEQIFLTREQVDDLAAAAGGDRLAILFLAYTGVRYGEMAALRVRNLNLLRRLALIAEAVVDDELQAILRAAERLVEAHPQYRLDLQ
jgi:integrase